MRAAAGFGMGTGTGDCIAVRGLIKKL